MLSFLRFPANLLPSLKEGSFSWQRLFVTSPGRIAAMSRVGEGPEVDGEIREGFASERKPGEKMLSSTAYTGTPLKLRALAEMEAARMGVGYRLYRIAGHHTDQQALNNASAWAYEFTGPAAAPLLAVSIGPLGRMIEQVYPRQAPEGLTALGGDHGRHRSLGPGNRGRHEP